MQDLLRLMVWWHPGIGIIASVTDVCILSGLVNARVSPTRLLTADSEIVTGWACFGLCTERLGKNDMRVTPLTGVLKVWQGEKRLQCFPSQWWSSPFWFCFCSNRSTNNIKPKVTVRCFFTPFLVPQYSFFCLFATFYCIFIPSHLLGLVYLFLFCDFSFSLNYR